MTTFLRPATARARDTWAATGRRLPIVALSWLVRREYLITVRAVDESAGVQRLPQPSWVPIVIGEHSVGSHRPGAALLVPRGPAVAH